MEVIFCLQLDNPLDVYRFSVQKTNKKASPINGEAFCPGWFWRLDYFQKSLIGTDSGDGGVNRKVIS